MDLRQASPLVAEPEDEPEGAVEEPELLGLEQVDVRSDWDDSPSPSPTNASAATPSPMETAESAFLSNNLSLSSILQRVKSQVEDYEEREGKLDDSRRSSKEVIREMFERRQENYAKQRDDSRPSKEVALRLTNPEPCAEESLHRSTTDGGRTEPLAKDGIPRRSFTQ